MKRRTIGKHLKGFSLRDRLYDSLRYIRECKNYIYFIMLLFLWSSFIGFFKSGQFTFLDPIIRKLVEQTSGLNFFELVSFIFSNNLQNAFFGFILGIVLGIFPIVNAILNGTVLGYVFSKVYDFSGVSDFWRILPHGIFELPAIFIALGLGVNLGMFVFSKNRIDELKKRFWKGLLALILVVIPLLIIAAIIESALIVLT